MAVMEVRCNNDYQTPYHKEVIVDTSSDLSSITGADAGSLALDASTGDVYYKKTNGSWAKVGGA